MTSTRLRASRRSRTRGGNLRIDLLLLHFSDRATLNEEEEEYNARNRRRFSTEAKGGYRAPSPDRKEESRYKGIYDAYPRLVSERTSLEGTTENRRPAERLLGSDYYSARSRSDILNLKSIVFTRMERASTLRISIFRDIPSIDLCWREMEFLFSFLIRC